MKVDDIIREVKRLSDDDQSILTSDIQDWIDLGINRINQALKCNIATISSLSTSTIPNFDARYHEILVLFAVAKYREGDSDYTAAQYFMGLFADMLKVMERDMPKNPSIRLDDSIIQLVAADTSGIFNVPTLPTNAYFNNIFVYKNDNDISQYCTFNSLSKQMIVDIANAPISVNDKITVDYEINSALDTPPYGFWGQTGW
jgi:hypothetical protein